MSGNMIIFGFGFLLGGFSVMLILGLVYLLSRRVAIPLGQGTEREPVEDATYPEICPQLTVLSGGKDPNSFKKAFSG